LDRLEAGYVDRLATSGDDEVVKGLALNSRAFQRPDLLVLMGSSELTFQDDYHAARLFAAEPSGFSVYTIGSGYRQSIHNFLTISAMDDELKGKEVALFISPSWFSKRIADKAYQKNFSLVQAYEFAFLAKLSPGLKQRAARRLLDLGSPGTDDALLKVALQALAAGDTRGRIRYAAAWPLGRIALQYLRLKDQVDLFRHIRDRKLKPVPRAVKPAVLDWAGLLERAGRDAQTQTVSNGFGIHDDYYAKYVAPNLQDLKDSARQETWLNSSEYADLALVLDALAELHVKPLFVSLPVLGSYYDYKGHAVTDRQAYYQRVAAQIRASGFPVADFGNREYEPGFMRDPWHPGWKGAVQIAQTLDQFRHDRLPAANR
jgi:D-alanine transfer protein